MRARCPDYAYSLSLLPSPATQTSALLASGSVKKYIRSITEKPTDAAMQMISTRFYGPRSQTRQLWTPFRTPCNGICFFFCRIQKLTEKPPQEVKDYYSATYEFFLAYCPIQLRMIHSLGRHAQLSYSAIFHVCTCRYRFAVYPCPERTPGRLTP